MYYAQRIVLYVSEWILRVRASLAGQFNAVDARVPLCALAHGACADGATPERIRRVLVVRLAAVLCIVAILTCIYGTYQSVDV
jgi:hypothetical protein